ncbi:MAG TPA: hypothetical protein VLA77_04730 [Candidatus Saccharimonadales bacterium]|nr:hypothetical protein [Candidatus Saccharimonadales bacterium]
MNFDPKNITECVYSSYDFDFVTGQLNLNYSLVADQAKWDFTEVFIFPNIENAKDSKVRRAVEKAAGLLFLAAGLSYYKAAAPPVLTVLTPVAEQEIIFLKKLIKNGLTEFAYVNKLLSSLEPKIVAKKIVELDSVALSDFKNGPIVPVGGGKDSIVTLEALKSAGFKPTLFSVNSFEPITKTVETAQLPYVLVTRKISSELVKINRDGGLNGHVPVTAINSCAALISAILNGSASVVFSNERSASVGNVIWEGIDVNHQWSKSLTAEKLISETIRQVVSPNIKYFSLLRPFSELRVVRKFSELLKYHSVFTSCNRAFFLDPARRRTWCGECDKCRFVFLMLAPYMSDRQLESIFKKNLFDDETQLDGFRELLGIKGHKPLECVGEIEESRTALLLAAKKSDWQNTPVVVNMLAEIPESALPTKSQQEYVFSKSKNHLVPTEFDAAADFID